MTDHDDDNSALDASLKSLLQDHDAPDDAGFSLRVMAALPDYGALREQHWARWVKRGQWAAISLAACGLAALLADNGRSLDLPETMAAVALAGLLVYWSIPSRWSRG